MKRALVTCFLAFAALFLLLTLVLAVVPHEANAHAFYDPKCCSGQDCAPVRPEAVTATARGWLVELQPGDHPFANRKMIFVVPYGSDKVKHSPDGNYHACISPGAEILFCLYVPEMGA